MKLLNPFFLVIALIFSISSKAEVASSVMEDTTIDLIDSSYNENEALFYRVGENQLIELVYNEIFGDYIGSTVQWLNVFGDNALLNFSRADFLMLESNRAGGFEIYDDDNNFVTVAPDLQDNYSLETSDGVWVKTRENGFNKTFFSNDKGKEYTMTFKFSFGGKKVIKDEKGYEITLNGKINGNYDITDNEGRKMQIKLDRSGVYRLIEGNQEIKKMVVQSVQSFRIEDGNGESYSIRSRGRFNDLVVSLPNGQDVLIKNRYRKILAPVKEEIRN